MSLTLLNKPRESELMPPWAQRRQCQARWTQGLSQWAVTNWLLQRSTIHRVTPNLVWATVATVVWVSRKSSMQQHSRGWSTFVVHCLHMKGVYMWQGTVSNCKRFTVTMGTVSDLQSHFPFDTPTQGDINTNTSACRHQNYCFLWWHLCEPDYNNCKIVILQENCIHDSLLCE